MGKCFPFSHSFLDGIREKKNKNNYNINKQQEHLFTCVTGDGGNKFLSVSIHSHLLALTCQRKRCSKHYEERHAVMVPALVTLTLQRLPLLEDNQQFQVA